MSGFVRQDYTVSCGAQSRPTSRRRSELRTQQLTEFVERVSSKKTIEAIEILTPQQNTESADMEEPKSTKFC